MTAILSQSERLLFKALADYLIPASGKMPAASSVGVHEDLLDRVLAARPDLVDGLKRGLAGCRTGAAGAALNALMKADESAFQAIGLAASGGYYMAAQVREKLGYPGQGEAPYDPHETPEYLTNGMIERVVRRGSLYRPTVKAAKA
ncbi:MAG: hypothetical protein Kilf2KO_41870 [Rhodospirillales bacterium]